MTLPDTDLLHLREDERGLFERTSVCATRDDDDGVEGWNLPDISAKVWLLVFSRLIEARKEIARLQIASGEVIQTNKGVNREGS